MLSAQFGKKASECQEKELMSFSDYFFFLSRFPPPVAYSSLNAANGPVIVCMEESLARRAVNVLKRLND